MDQEFLTTRSRGNVLDKVENSVWKGKVYTLNLDQHHILFCGHEGAVQWLTGDYSSPLLTNNQI